MSDQASRTDTSQPNVGQSLGTLVSQLSSDFSRLLQQELRLAKAELRDEAAKAGKGAGMLGGAGFAGWMTALFLSLTAMWALDQGMDVTFAALIVTVVWGVIAAVLFVMGRKALRTVNPKPEQTLDSLKEDAQWLKAHRN
jgi:uncharacterized membrane protein YqjE